MSKYNVDFVAKESMTGGMEIDLDDTLLPAQMEDAALEEIEYAYPALTDIEIVKCERATD